ncbi:MAG: UDP-N-acetylmuramate--L-alanine ligase [Planctomycetota bacterium]|nr:MAG: UDP-N-acetylmuramate--L-alanine ligase [Planctomycetota bacterium]
MDLPLRTQAASSASPETAPGPLPAAAGLTIATARAVHLVGAGGAGVSALGRLLCARGVAVSGSDARANRATAALAALGARLQVGVAAGALPPQAQLVVHSPAVPPLHPELEQARRRGLPVLSYPEALGQLLRTGRGLAVAGTHGKTTTTAMLAAVLVEAGADPTAIIGGDAPPDAPGGARAGRGELVLVEACEYRRAFLALAPELAVITNVDADHLDCYRDLDEIAAAFHSFASRVPPHGCVVVCAECEPALEAVRGIPARVITYAIDRPAEVRAVGLVLEQGLPRFGVRLAGGPPLGRVALGVSGRHNALNALAVVAAARALGLDEAAIRRGLGRFSGVRRRLERVAERAGLCVFDDYAHHPAEIRATLAALRERYPGARLRAVLEPHQHARARRLLAEFAEALLRADESFITPIYDCRDTEEDRRAVRAEDLAAAVRARGGRAEAIADGEVLLQRLLGQAQPGDVIVTLGAGEVDRIAHRLAALLGARAAA